MKNTVVAVLMTAFGALLLMGCDPMKSATDQGSVIPPGGQGAQQQPSFNLNFTDASGAVLYQDSPLIGRAEFLLATPYSLTLNQSNANVVTATFHVTVINTLTPLAAPLVNSNVTPGSALSLNFPSAGEYQMTITATAASGTLTRTVDVRVTCDPTAQTDLEAVIDENAITASSNGSNIYTYNASGITPVDVVPGTTLPRYECAWDFNGDGIQDHNFESCESPIPEFSNHVLSRTLTVQVRDRACNVVASASKAVNLPEPSTPPGINFIRGTVSQPGTPPDARTNLEHVSSAFNILDPAKRPVFCNYDAQAGLWKIDGIFGYNNFPSPVSLQTSMNHGMQVNFSGVPQPPSTFGGGAIDTSNARLSSLNFYTDRQSDTKPRMMFSGNSCSFTFNLVATPSAGGPCSASSGQSRDAVNFTVIGDGTFQCTGLTIPGVTPGPAPVDVNNGSFYCIFDVPDSCIGGGGGGGGGIPPIEF